MFRLHERLKADTIEISRLQLSRLLLMNDKSLPWLILVPEREGVQELDELPEEDRAGLMEEIVLASRVIQHLYTPDKINIGALGNLVPQLHLHVIGRFKTDRAWPGPIWGTGPGEPYSLEEAKAVCERFRNALIRGF
jgi:diadenosine tetraphosphate (Ap4A) HIT family hydrolase